ncbi:MAG: hypothetical protein MN733_41770 [Nitrososphaera sp.]|nr:hypothetical protein [Nitrososphaera sp.]
MIALSKNEARPTAVQKQSTRDKGDRIRWTLLSMLILLTGCTIARPVNLLQPGASSESNGLIVRIISMTTPNYRTIEAVLSIKNTSAQTLTISPTDITFVTSEGNILTPASGPFAQEYPVMNTVLLPLRILMGLIVAPVAIPVIGIQKTFFGPSQEDEAEQIQEIVSHYWKETIIPTSSETTVKVYFYDSDNDFAKLSALRLRNPLTGITHDIPFGEGVSFREAS